MGYILKQYNHIVGDGSDDEYNDPHNPGQKLNYFLNPIPFDDDDIILSINFNGFCVGCHLFSA